MLDRGFFYRSIRYCAAVLAFALPYQIFDASAQQVRISNLSNINVPRWVTGDPDIIQNVLVCVYVNHNTQRTYALTAIGDGPGFFLRNGSFTVPYTVTWNDGGAQNPSGGTTAPMVNKVKLTLRDNARTKNDSPKNSTDCNGGSSPTARLRISVPHTNMGSARDGTFTGTLTLILYPS